MQDCTGKPGLSTPQKVTCALRQLGYGVASNATDEYIRIGDTTAWQALKNFVNAVIYIYSAKYLRKPTEDDQKKILEENSSQGFPGCQGSLDCMHVGWKNCPTAWAGQFTGKEKEPTIVLEVVATKNRWIWHSFFGTPGTNNDLNILDRSPLFDNYLNGQEPTVTFEINGTHFNSAYYLCDGIYPSWGAFVKSISNPSDMPTKHFNTVQEAVRKDIERAFAGLQSKWHILTSPIQAWYQEEIHSIVMCWIILHNMMVEEGVSEVISDPTPSELHPTTSFLIIPATLTNQFEGQREILNNIQSERIHRELTAALVAYQWARWGCLVSNP